MYATPGLVRVFDMGSTIFVENCHIRKTRLLNLRCEYRTFQLTKQKVAVE